MVFFLIENNGVGGCVIYGNGNQFNVLGVFVYFNGGEDLVMFFFKVEVVGGLVVMFKIFIGENGFMVIFMDMEGN